MSQITIDTAQLKEIVETAVEDVFRRHGDSIRSQVDDEIEDLLLARLVDQACESGEEHIPGEEFLSRLKARL